MFDFHNFSFTTSYLLSEILKGKRIRTGKVSYDPDY